MRANMQIKFTKPLTNKNEAKARGFRIKINQKEICLDFLNSFVMLDKKDPRILHIHQKNLRKDALTDESTDTQKWIKLLETGQFEIQEITEFCCEVNGDNKLKEISFLEFFNDRGKIELVQKAFKRTQIMYV